MSGRPLPSSSSSDKGGKRDTSPSAHSQISGLEWDPSADVGTSPRHEHYDDGVERETQTPPSGSLEIETRSAHGTRVVDLLHSAEEGGGPRPRMTRSRSYEDPIEVRDIEINESV